MDRFYGQRMNDDQIARIYRYDQLTLRHDLPLWVYGVRYAASQGDTANHSMGDSFLPWDYGLDADCRHMSRMRRDGRVPFTPWNELWHSLEMRRVRLSDMWEKRRL